jgi:hypothetical protein
MQDMREEESGALVLRVPEELVGLRPCLLEPGSRRWLAENILWAMVFLVVAAASLLATFAVIRNELVQRS